MLPNDRRGTMLQPVDLHRTTAPEASPTAIGHEEAAAMLRAALRLFERWALTDAEARRLLGQPSERTFARWKRHEIARVPHDTKQRLSYLMGIHKALRLLFKDAARGYAWTRRPNAAFGGQSALDRMLAGDVTDLAAVRCYLDAERGAW